MFKYAVITTYSFDQDCEVYRYKTEEEACEALKQLAEKEYKIQKDENEYNAELNIADDLRYASVTTYWDDDNEVCYYHVVEL